MSMIIEEGSVEPEYVHGDGKGVSRMRVHTGEDPTNEMFIMLIEKRELVLQPLSHPEPECIHGN